MDTLKAFDLKIADCFESQKKYLFSVKLFHKIMIVKAQGDGMDPISHKVLFLSLSMGDHSRRSGRKEDNTSKTAFQYSPQFHFHHSAHLGKKT